MKAKNFIEAMQIITAHHTTEIVVNKSFNGMAHNDPENPNLYITHCCGAVVNKLIEAGFSLSMNEGFMGVEDYCKK